MGRHSAPEPLGAPDAGRRSWLMTVAVVLVVLGVAAVTTAVMRSGGDEPVTARPATSTQQTPEALKAASPTGTPSPAATSESPDPVTSSPARRPPTLDLKLVGTSYVTVRLPGGRTLLSALLRKGQHRVFDQKRLHVVIGNAAAVRVTVNGHQRKLGHRGDVATFTVRRR